MSSSADLGVSALFNNFALRHCFRWHRLNIWRVVFYVHISDPNVSFQCSPSLTDPNDAVFDFIT